MPPWDFNLACRVFLLFPGGGTKWSSAASLDSKPEPFEAWNDWFWNRYSCTPIFESDLVTSWLDFWDKWLGYAWILDDFGGIKTSCQAQKTWSNFVLPRQFRSGTNHRSTAWGFRKLQQAAGADRMVHDAWRLVGRCIQHNLMMSYSFEGYSFRMFSL